MTRIHINFSAFKNVSVLTHRDLVNIEGWDLCTYRNDFLRFNVNLYCFSESENIRNHNNTSGKLTMPTYNVRSILRSLVCSLPSIVVQMLECKMDRENWIEFKWVIFDWTEKKNMNFSIFIQTFQLVILLA